MSKNQHRCRGPKTFYFSKALTFLLIIGLCVEVLPLSYLVVSMLKLDYSKNQHFTFKWSLVSSLLLIVVSLVTGIFPFHAA